MQAILEHTAIISLVTSFIGMVVSVYLCYQSYLDNKALEQDPNNSSTKTLVALHSLYSEVLRLLLQASVVWASIRSLANPPLTIVPEEALVTWMLVAIGLACNSLLGLGLRIQVQRGVK